MSVLGLETAGLFLYFHSISISISIWDPFRECPCSKALTIWFLLGPLMFGNFCMVSNRR